MPTGRKRTLSSTDRIVSPPPVRRRFTQHTASQLSEEVQHVELSNDPKALTVYSWNVNGVGPLLQKKLDFTRNKAYPVRSFLETHGWPHVLCLQEVKISRADEVTQRRFEHAANAGSHEDEPTYTTHFSLPRDKFNATGFGGKVHGVATLIRDDINSAPASSITTTRPDWDLEGRVLIHNFPRAWNNLVIVNGYWVNGTANPYRDPTTGKESGTRHDHKLQFHEHMLELSRTLSASDTPFLLIGDMNVAPTLLDGHPNLRISPVQHVYNRRDFTTKFLQDHNEANTVDLFRNFHPTARKYTYHSRNVPWGTSCDRVDLALASRTLVQRGAVLSVNICDNPKDRGHSDHVPLWVRLNMAKDLEPRSHDTAEPFSTTKSTDDGV